MRTLQPTSSYRHKILRIAMQLRPSVVNNPKDPKHEALPSDLFMPGKHPNATKQSDIQALLRLLHREMNQSGTCTTCYHSLLFANSQPIASLFRFSPNSGCYDIPYQEGDGLTRSSLSQENRSSTVEQSGVTEHTFKLFSFLLFLGLVAYTRGTESQPCSRATLACQEIPQRHSTMG